MPVTDSCCISSPGRAEGLVFAAGGYESPVGSEVKILALQWALEHRNFQGAKQVKEGRSSEYCTSIHSPSTISGRPSEYYAEAFYEDGTCTWT